MWNQRHEVLLSGRGDFLFVIITRFFTFQKVFIGSICGDFMDNEIIFPHRTRTSRRDSITKALSTVPLSIVVDFEERSNGYVHVPNRTYCFTPPILVTKSPSPHRSELRLLLPDNTRATSYKITPLLEVNHEPEEHHSLQITPEAKVFWWGKIDDDSPILHVLTGTGRTRHGYYFDFQNMPARLISLPNTSTIH